LIATKEILKDIIELLETEVEMHKDMLGDADDDPEYAEALNREIFSAQFIIDKIRKDARILEEKEGKKL
jgi:hypothetical protein